MQVCRKLNFVAETSFSPDFNKIKEFLNFDQQTEWKQIKNSFLYFKLQIFSLETLTKVFVKKEDNSSVFSVRSDAIQENKDLFELISLLKDPEKRLAWDKHLKSFELIKQIDENSDLFYLRMQPPFKLITPRDYVVYRYYVNNKKHPEVFDKVGLQKTDKNQSMLYMRSVELASNPPKKGVIRAELHIMLILFEECQDNPKNIRIQFINHADMRGNIPKKIFNFLLPKKIPQMMKDLDKAYETIVVKKSK